VKPVHAALLAASLCWAPPALAQEQEAIEPDRPDVTNGTHIVDTGLLQIEVGGLISNPQRGQRAWGSPITARLGVAEWLELRVGTDGVVGQTDQNVSVVGFGNVQLGAKLRLWSDPGGLPVLSVLPQVNLPTADAARGLGSGLADYTIALLTGTDLGRHAHVDANYGIGAIGSGDADTHFVQHLVSVSASYALTDNWNPYAEGFWFSRQDPSSGSVVAIDAGAIYQLGTRYAIDGGAQFGVSSEAPRLAVFGGVSVIVGDVLGGHGPEARARHARARPPRTTRP
jgi:Putative MetA-pathway of phenol degradation